MNTSSWAERLSERLYQAGTSAAGQPLIRPEPHPGQQVFLDCDHPRRLIVAHRRWGKDWATVMDILRRIDRWKDEPHRRRLEPAIHIGVIYPTYELVDDFWGALKRMVSHPEVAECWNGKPQRLTLKCGAMIAVRTASDPDLLVSRGYDLVILGEAARIRREAWLSVLPALASPGRAGMAVHQTTPFGQNWIAAQARDPSWWRLIVPIWEPGGRGRHPLANPAIPEEAILEEERQLPERWFRREWQADFLSAENAIFRNVRDRVAAAPASPKPPLVAGVDLAKHGDASVFALFDADGHMVAIDRMVKANYPIQSERLITMLRDYGVKRCVVESNGPGEPFYDNLLKDLHNRRLEFQGQGQPTLVPFATTAQSKRQMIDALTIAFERSQITLLPDDELLNEFEAFEMGQTAAGNIRFAAPEGGFDDRVMACALAWTEIKPKQPSVVGMYPGPKDLKTIRSPWHALISRGESRLRDL